MGVKPEKRREYVARYRAKLGVREAEKEYGRKYGRDLYATAEGRAYVLFKGARFRARERGLPFDLDVEFVLLRLKNGRCPVLGLPFDLSPVDATHFNPLAPTLDRVSGVLGYVKSNVEVVSAWWNIAKGQWTPEFNRMAVRRAAEYFTCKDTFPWES